MRALVVRDGRASVEDVEPEHRPGECRVRVLRAGVCATDLALARGYMGFAGIPGHEFVGETADGRRVVGEINAACGRCETCRAGLPRHCPARTVLGILGRPGAFAEELSLPQQNLHPVPDAVSDDAAVFVEPLAAALEITEQVQVSGRVLVAGDGKLGLLCAHVLALAGADVSVLGRHPERSDLLPAGARHLTQAPTRAFDFAVEATGDPGALARLLPCMKPRGTIVLKTTCEKPGSYDLSPLVVDEITLVGSRCGPFAPALELLARGAVPVERMIAATLPLSRGAEALQRADEPGVLKVLVDTFA